MTQTDDMTGGDVDTRASFLAEMMERVEQLLPVDDNTPENVSAISETLEEAFFKRHRDNTDKITDRDILDAIEAHLGEIDE